MNAFIDTLQKNIQDIFPESMVDVRLIKFLNQPYVKIFFTLGKDKSEWSHGIYENDPMIQNISIEGVTADGEPTGNMRVESGGGGGAGDMVIKSVSKYKVYDTVKFGWRNFTATSAEQVIKRLTDYFKKVKKVMHENVDKMADDHKKMVIDKYGKMAENLAKMKHIKLFEDYTLKHRIREYKDFNLNEGVSKIDRIEGYLEGDFMELPLVKRITEGKELGWMDDYNLDHDDKKIWIELKNIDQKYVDEIEKDYNSFAKDFEDWAVSHKLADAEILSSDKDKEGKYTLTFSVDHK